MDRGTRQRARVLVLAGSLLLAACAAPPMRDGYTNSAARASAAAVTEARRADKERNSRAIAEREERLARTTDQAEIERLRAEIAALAARVAAIEDEERTAGSSAPASSSASAPASSGATYVGPRGGVYTISPSGRKVYKKR